MRTVSSQSTETAVDPKPKGIGLETYSETLSDGRVITIREMTGRDLLYMEDELSDFKETKKSFYLIERLNVGGNKISFDDIADLTLRDIKVLTELVGKVSGMADEEEGKSPK
jgi:hypothetical protein